MPFSRYSLILFLATLALASGCDYRREKGNREALKGAAWYEKVRNEVFLPKCISCHGSSGGVNLETYEGIKRSLAAIERAALLERTMPKGGALSPAEYDLLDKWIKAGAPLDSPDPAASPKPEEPLKPNFISIKKRIFEVRCLSCHSPDGPGKNVSLATVRDLIDSPRTLVIPGNAEESGLLIALTRTDSKRMPPPETGAALPSEQIAVIRSWIENGAPETETSGPSEGSIHEPIDQQSLTYATVRDRIFAPKCIGCHTTSGRGVNLETYASVKDNLGRISIAVFVDKTMPKEGRLTQAELDFLAAWIRAGAPEGEVGPEEPLKPLFSSIQKKILNVRCVVCHNPTGEAKNVPFQTLDDLLKSPRDLVLPGNPEESGLVIAITRTDDKRMPPPRTGNALLPQEISTIQQWITEGAKP